MTTGQTSLRDRYRGQRIFITGASGLLGQVVLEKVLRSLPEIERAVLLMRPRGRIAPQDRLPDIFASPLFARLRAERPDFDAWWPTKVTTVQGALGEPRFGLDQDAWRTLADSITGIIHIGALASFDQPLDRVLDVNTTGALDVLELARAAGDAPMVHVSTCYVCGNTYGFHAEELIPWGHTPSTIAEGAHPAFDPEEELAFQLASARRLRLEVEAGQHDRLVKRDLPETHLSEERLATLRREYVDQRLGRAGQRAASKLGWPDAYPMSKAWAEQLMTRRRGNVPLAIVRPALLGSTLYEPEPGWLLGLRMADPLIVASGRGTLQSFPGDPDAVLDLVPTDLVANVVLSALPERGVSQDAPVVYHAAGSAKNPLALGDFCQIVYDSATQHPFHDLHNGALQPTHVQLVEHARFQRTLKRERKRLALKLAMLDELGLPERTRPLRARMRFLHYAHLLGRAYAPYSGHQLRFETDRSDSLERSLVPEERTSFPMDVGRVNWTRYITDIHVPAVFRLAGSANGVGRNGGSPSKNGRK